MLETAPTEIVVREQLEFDDSLDEQHDLKPRPMWIDFELGYTESATSAPVGPRSSVRSKWTKKQTL
jgi:hypothetical protein